jgi:hypothetical protein
MYFLMLRSEACKSILHNHGEDAMRVRVTKRPNRPVKLLSLLSILLLFGSLLGFMRPISNVSAAETGSRRLPAPAPAVPADGAVVKGVQFTQSWSEVAGAKHYLYESYTNRQATELRAKQRVDQTTKVIAHVADGTFWWRVRAVDDHGTEGRWSKLQRVTTDSEAPTIRPLLTIGDEPVQGTVRFVFESTDKNPWRITSGVFSEVPAGGMPLGGTGNNMVEAVAVTVTAKVTLTIDTLMLPNGRETIIVNAQDQAGNIQERRFYFTVANPVAPAPEAPGPVTPPLTGTTESAVAAEPPATPRNTIAVPASVAQSVPQGEFISMPTTEGAATSPKVLSMQTERASVASATRLAEANNASSTGYWILAAVILGVPSLWGAVCFIRSQIS